MLKQILALWKNEKGRKGTTLHRRLLVFFVLMSVSLILVFALLLSLFGITGKDAKLIENEINSELSILSDRIDDDFGQLALEGIAISENLTVTSDKFFDASGISAAELQKHPELIEPLLAEYVQTLLSAAKNHHCGGVFVVLDATAARNTDTSRAGLFFKKTQPDATDVVGVQIHCLRGPADIAREHSLMLMGQWKMEFDIAGEEFVDTVIQTAKENPDLSLSRLYYWSGRVMLEDNSEAGMLLCVPIRSEDGTVLGICGFEVSDRLFKKQYTPEGGKLEDLFTVMAPTCENGICTSKGLLAGSRYLSSTNPTVNLTQVDSHEGFVHYSGDGKTFGGKTTQIRMHPVGSPYESENWSVSVLMPKDILHNAIKGNHFYFVCITLVLLIVSLVVSFLFSHQYLRPVNRAIDKIKSNTYDEKDAGHRLIEIDDLFDFLSRKDKEHDEALQQKQRQLSDLHGEHEKAQTEISRLSYSRRNEIDPDNYAMFIDNLRLLTDTERIVFEYYLDGKSAKEILEIMGIKESTLKYHNRNIYDKLGVTSRKELLRYAALMQKEKRGGETL